jgi:hypothetical protein
MLIADASNLVQIVESEIHTRTRTHIQALYTEINGIGTGIYRRPQALIAPYRSHYLKFFSFHDRKFTKFP